MASAFEQSVADGPHAFLASLAGDWQGRVRTWFEPEVLADESPIRGRIYPVLGGRFIIHEYSFTLDGEPYNGLALHGYDTQQQRYLTAWVDSFHNGTSILFSQGKADSPAYAVLGSYSDGQGGPEWGWRTAIEAPDAQHLLITHYNIMPDEPEAKAVEISYERCA